MQRKLLALTLLLCKTAALAIPSVSGVTGAGWSQAQDEATYFEQCAENPSCLVKPDTNALVENSSVDKQSDVSAITLPSQYTLHDTGKYWRVFLQKDAFYMMRILAEASDYAKADRWNSAQFTIALPPEGRQSEVAVYQRACPSGGIHTVALRSAITADTVGNSVHFKDCAINGYVINAELQDQKQTAQGNGRQYRSVNAQIRNSEEMLVMVDGNFYVNRSAAPTRTSLSSTAFLYRNGSFGYETRNSGGSFANRSLKSGNFTVTFDDSMGTTSSIIGGFRSHGANLENYISLNADFVPSIGGLTITTPDQDQSLYLFTDNGSAESYGVLTSTATSHIAATEKWANLDFTKELKNLLFGLPDPMDFPGQ